MKVTARKYTVHMLSVLFSLVFASGAFAGQRYLVVMKNNQSFKTAHKTYVRQGQFNLRTFAAQTDMGSLAGANAVVEDSLEKLNTLVVNADDSEMAKLKANSDVAIVEKEVFHAAPRPVKGFLAMSFMNRLLDIGATEPVNSEVGATWGVKAVKASEAWTASNNKGAGARVLVLDTGMDTSHPSLKANFEKGQDFTGTSEGADITDTVGHGTHVSGTIAGVMDASGFSGVAPEAKILMGRVCSGEGCSNVAVAQGINWGIQENVDVISMSLGGMWSTPAERAAVASAETAGVTVVAASGNDGSARVSYPAALPSVIAVGAVDDTLKKAEFSQYGPELSVVAPGVSVVSTVPMGSGRESEVVVVIDGQSVKVKSASLQGAKELSAGVSTDLVFAGLGKAEDFAKVNVEGKYALVSRGEISFLEKVQHAIEAKAAGVVIYNNAPGLIHGALTQDGSILDVPATLVEQEVGEKLKAALEQGKPAQASMMTARTNYTAFDGTSMATPHVAGVVALVKAANKNLKPAEVKEILKRTAQVLGPNDANQYGAGLVNAEAAVNAALGH